MELREAVAEEIRDTIKASQLERSPYLVLAATDRILSLLRADALRREREAFCDGVKWMLNEVPLGRDIEDWQPPLDDDVKAEAARRYPEAKP